MVGALAQRNAPDAFMRCQTHSSEYACGYSDLRELSGFGRTMGQVAKGQVETRARELVEGPLAAKNRNPPQPIVYGGVRRSRKLPTLRLSIDRRRRGQRPRPWTLPLPHL